MSPTVQDRSPGHGTTPAPGQPEGQHPAQPQSQTQALAERPSSIPPAPARRIPSPTSRALALATALIVLVVLMVIPVPETVRHSSTAQLTTAGQRALAVLGFALVLWIAEALPFHVTGLAAMLLLVLVGAGEYSEIVRAGFGDDVLVFFIGVLLLAGCLTRSGLAKRFSLLVLSLTGNTTRAIIFGFLVAGAILSMWITALAASAILMPFAHGILEDEKEHPGHSRFGRALMIAVAWGSLLGALGTPAGSGSNPIAIRFLSEMAGYNVSFFDWMSFGIPALIVLLPAAWLILILMFPPERPTIARSRNEIRTEFQTLPPLSRQELVTGVIFILTIATWIGAPALGKLLGTKISISMGALFAILLIFLPGSTGYTWKELQKDIDWAGILLIATGISLGMTLYRTGAAAWLASSVLASIGSLPDFWRLVAVTLGVFVIKIVFSSNTLTGTIIVPLILSLGTSLAIDARGIALAAAFASNLAFILVTTSPVNVIPYTTGYFSIKDMAKAGILLALVASFVLALSFTAIAGLRGGF